MEILSNANAVLAKKAGGEGEDQSWLLCTANVIAIKVTGFPCVTLEPCKVHAIITGKSVQPFSL